MATLKSGSLALFDTIGSGLVKCKVLSIRQLPRGGTAVEFVVTATQGAYRKGEKLESTSTWVVPRKSVRRGKYFATIKPYKVEADS
jgi:hypothetical protein